MTAPQTIQNYSTKATQYFGFLGNPAEESKGFEKLYFGVELELTARDKWLQEVPYRSSNSLWQHIYPYCGDFAIATHDSSIRTAGFELKSAPMLYSEAKRNYGKLFGFIEDNKEAFTAYGDNCGIHIHISRNALSDMHLSRLNMFLNAAENRSFVQFIAEREGNLYCRYNNYVTDEAYRNQTQHTDAVHVGAETVEIRIFKGTCLVDSFMKNLEFIHAVICYTNPELAKDFRSVADFKQFVLDNQAEYPHLHTFIEEGDLIEARKSREVEDKVKAEADAKAKAEADREARVAARMARKYGVYGVGR